MDFYRNPSDSSGIPSKYPPEQVISHTSSKLDDFFPGENKESDVGLEEWLSVFLEDCFSSNGTSYTSEGNTNATTATHLHNPHNKGYVHSENKQKLSLHEIVVPGKLRTKRKRATITNPTLLIGGPHNHVEEQTLHLSTSDPPLLHQAYWLADSELIVPEKKEKEEEKRSSICLEGSTVRRCSHCLAQRTPQWRAGPMGPKTLCNACGVRFKSGRLLPEYRPAKSPTFESFKHSNSHKKVMEMRMAM
ncbi:GATA transcription factor 9-like [Tasmannia lanceolata]|uniref:GATA transcription factor 9-like n=1 Tax=Tasmannia lanceolata TaxID=3420 RepID=UPI004063A443